MRLLVLAALCFAVGLPLDLAQVAGAQATWRRQYPPSGRDLRDVDMLNALEGWAVGLDGVLLHTNNGGVHWFERSAPTSDLRAVGFFGSVGFTAGEGILKSADAGQTWSTVNSAGGVQDLYVLDSQNVWAVTDDARVLRTTNGGSSWSTTALAGATGGVRSIRFRNTQQGWVCGDLGLFQRTLDGGATWQAVGLGTAADLFDVHFATSTLGWVLAGDRLHKTSDGGSTWQPQPLPAGVFANRLSWLGLSYGWVAGPSGAFHRTVDGGATWSAVGSIPGASVTDFDMGDLWGGLAVGLDEQIWRTGDGGASWTLVHGGSATQAEVVFDITALDTSRAWASASSGRILRTTDGGATWIENPTDSSTQWHTVDFFDGQHGYAAGRRQGFYPMKAWTDDGGVTWNVQQGLGMYDFNDIDALDADTAIACADTYLHRTSDHGLSWQLISTSPLAGYNAADFIDAQRGWVVGTKFYRTSDGGLTWTFLIDPPQEFFDVSFADAQRGWAVGAAGAVLRTSDGGTTWTPQNAGAGSAYLYGVEALSGGEAWVVGSNGFAARTQDGGQTWQQLPPATSSSTTFYAAAFLTGDEGWIGGGFENGLWRRTAGVGGGCGSQSYCVSKTNSLGLQAHLQSQGEPSATLGAFGIRVQGGVPGNPGLLIVSHLGPAAVPITGGTLCVQPPFDRLPVHILDPGGFTTYAITVGPQAVGTSSWFQFWYRDPQHPDGSGMALSDGLRVTYCE